MLDEDLNIYLLEINTSPTLHGAGEKEEFIVQMLLDHFEIVLGLLRSRVKRVINFVNLFSQSVKLFDSDSQSFKNEVEKKRDDWNSIILNRFEKDYLPSSSNQFQLVWDENMVGEARYNFLLKSECMLE